MSEVCYPTCLYIQEENYTFEGKVSSGQSGVLEAARLQLMVVALPCSISPRPALDFSHSSRRVEKEKTHLLVIATHLK